MKTVLGLEKGHWKIVEILEKNQELLEGKKVGTNCYTIHNRLCGLGTESRLKSTCNKVCINIGRIMIISSIKVRIDKVDIQMQARSSKRSFHTISLYLHCRCPCPASGQFDDSTRVK